MKAISLNQTKVVGGNVYQEMYISYLSRKRKNTSRPIRNKLTQIEQLTKEINHFLREN